MFWMLAVLHGGQAPGTTLDRTRAIRSAKDPKQPGEPASKAPKDTTGLVLIGAVDGVAATLQTVGEKGAQSHSFAAAIFNNHLMPRCVIVAR